MTSPLRTTGDFRLGKPLRSWAEGQAKSITFIVTEDCNLRCRYCYLVGKNKLNSMPWQVAQRAVDHVLDRRVDFPEPSVIWEFIGGEPLIEIDLIDRITDYAKMQAYARDHPWFANYRISISTNGILYGTPKVQRFLRKNRDHLSIGISVDGSKRKHDRARVWPDGRGSYDSVLKNVPLWLSQFPGSSTKATFAPGDIPFIKESILDLWTLGIKDVAANVVFEKGWSRDDPNLFQEQLCGLADHIIEHRMWRDHNCSFFSEQIGHPQLDDQNWCGAGKMLAIDPGGRFLPCVRFAAYSLCHKPARVVGDVSRGYDHDKLRPFLALNLSSQSTRKCVECQVASGCAWCQGCNYDNAESDTIYQRATFVCEMHKARCRANAYYWSRFRAATANGGDDRFARSEASSKSEELRQS